MRTFKHLLLISTAILLIVGSAHAATSDTLKHTSDIVALSMDDVTLTTNDAIPMPEKVELVHYLMFANTKPVERPGKIKGTEVSPLTINQHRQF